MSINKVLKNILVWLLISFISGICWYFGNKYLLAIQAIDNGSLYQFRTTINENLLLTGVGCGFCFSLYLIICLIVGKQIRLPIRLVLSIISFMMLFWVFGGFGAGIVSIGYLSKNIFCLLLAAVLAPLLQYWLIEYKKN